jgi:hypothetical protein
MQGRDFIYFLFDENNNSYYAYGDTVLTSASLKPLEFTPDGWTKIQVQNQRNPTYFALDRSFTVPLEYVKDGAQILKHIYYNYGVEAKVYMSICEQKLYFDNTHYGFYYTLLYRGEIDLANFKHDSTKVTVNIMEGGIVKLIKAYENTKYEIPVDVPDAVEMYMDGIELKQRASFIIADSTNNFYGNHSVPLSLIGQESFDINIKSVERVQLGGNSGGDQNNKLAQDELWFYRASTNIPISIEWDFDMTAQLAPGIPPNPAVQLFLAVRNLRDDGSLVGPATILNQFNGPTNVYRKNNFSGTATISGIEPDTSLYLFMGINIIGDTGDRAVQFFYDTDEPFYFRITDAFYKHRPTTPKALRPLYVFQQLIDKISDGAYTGVSDYLTNEINDVVVSCGDAIREIDGAVIKTSLRDFFTSFNSDFGLALGMLGAELRLEPKSFWVQYTDMIDLGEVSKMKVSPANDLLVNNIKIGSPNQEYDDVNGKQEFNTTQERSAPITRVSRELNLVSVYRKDCYGIEFTRLNLDGKTTTDNKSDNDVFMIHIEDFPQPDGTYKLDRSLNAGATGLLTPSTVFNLYLTPARAIRRNGNYIRSLFYKLDHKYLKFQTTDKNDQVVAGGITENADIQIASLDAPLFSCNYLEFETKVPINLLELLKANPLKAFTGTWAGFSFVGIPEKISVQPGDNGAQTYKLLASPSTDLTQLITIDG